MSAKLWECKDRVGGASPCRRYVEQKLCDHELEYTGAEEAQRRASKHLGLG